MVAGIALGGRALHAGGHTSVVLVHRPGPLAIRQGCTEVSLHALRIARADHGVAVEHDTLRVDLVEHVLSAIGGLGIVSDLRIDVFGPEVPLLDGGSFRFANCMRQLGLRSRRTRPRVIAKAMELRSGAAVYRFEPGASVELSAEIVFDHALVQVRHARWQGCAEDYRCRIASARTFGFRKDAEKLRSAGRARSVDLRWVVVLDDDGTSPSDPRPSEDECARHKLLDLIGDLTLDGGVPLGRIEAYQPGHAATHDVLEQARAAGVFEPNPCHDDANAAT